MAVILIRPEGPAEKLTGPPSLEEAKGLIGGFVERVCPRATPDVVFLCDEDGFAKGLPANLIASILYGDTVVGPIILMSREEAKAGAWL